MPSLTAVYVLRHAASHKGVESYSLVLIIEVQVPVPKQLMHLEEGVPHRFVLKRGAIH